MKSDEVKGYLYMGAAVVGAYLVYKATTKTAAVVKDVATALNPADSQNIVNRGVTGLGAWATGDAGWTLGGWIYDLTHDDPFAAQAPVEQLAPLFSNDQINRIGSAPALYTPTIYPTGEILGSGPSFNDITSGNWNYY